MAEQDLDAIVRAMSSVATALAAEVTPAGAPTGAPSVAGADLLRASRQLLDSVELQLRRGGGVEVQATPTVTVTVTVTVARQR